MTIKDRLLALCVVVVWGVNFVVMKIGLHDMPPFLLAGLRFLLVALPAILLVPRPALPLRWLVAYGMTISFGQFAFLFCAIKMGMPVGMASLVIQSQAFFTLMLGAWWLGERLQWNHWLGIVVAALGMVVLSGDHAANAALPGMTLITLMLTLAAASWACGNLCNKHIMRQYRVNAMSLVVWSALIPVGPFLLCSWLFEGADTIVESLITMRFADYAGADVSVVYFYADWVCHLGQFVVAL